LNNLDQGGSSIATYSSQRVENSGILSESWLNADKLAALNKSLFGFLAVGGRFGVLLRLCGLCRWLQARIVAV